MNNDNDSRENAHPIIEPATFTVKSDDARSQSTKPDPRLRVFVLASGIAFLTFTLFVVIVVLPRWVNSPETPLRVVAVDDRPNTSATLKDGVTDEGPIDKSPDDLETPEQRTNTQELLRGTLEKVDALESMQAESWAKTEMHVIREKVAEGEAAYREKRYVSAQNAYLDSVERIDRLLAEIPDIVEKLTDAGNLALDNGHSAQAAAAFDQVLTMEPDNAAAKRGRARADTLDQVIALVGQAEGYERLQQTDKALAAYREALKIDAEAPGASASVERIGREKRETAFRAAMSRGFTALHAESFGKARRAFEQAAKLDSNAPEVKAALKQVANAGASYKIERYLGAARKAERAEQWKTAATNYNEALKIDARLSSASAAKRIAEARHRLNVRLIAYIARPDRLATAAVYDEASRILENARTVVSPGKVLQRQVTDLSRALILARTPVAINFRSDNVTIVTIYRIGALGSFDNREVSLLPGQYTAVGKRDGYRDVRVEFEVKPAAQGPEITIQCDQQFAFGS